MSDNSFYITLLSNSSADYYTDNTTAHFLTKLPKSIKLEGEWVVGLVEFQYPCSMYNVQDHENMIYLKKKVMSPSDKITKIVDIKTHIPATTYDNVNHFIQAFNDNPQLKNYIKFRYDNLTKMVGVTTINKDLTSFITTPILSLQLGFKPKTNLSQTSFAINPVNLYLGLPSQLFVYTDIIQPQVVGDVITTLLRIIPLDPTKFIYGAYKTHIFSPAHYVPVLRREFDTMEIDIRTTTGARVPFQFGVSCVKLHFQRIK